MKRVAPELDCLMWTLVEENNPQAVDQFLERYPELRGELERRGKMVNGLKNMKPESKLVLAPPPPFRPKSTAGPTVPRGVAIAVATLTLAALGLASFTISYFASPQKPAAPSKVSVPTKAQPDHFDRSSSVVKQDGLSKTPGAGDEPPIANKGAWMRPISIKVAAAPLSSVLQAIGAQAGEQIILAPGMKSDPSVAIEYNDRTAIDILTDLGKLYGFTPFDQGDGSIIVVPAVEEDGKTSEPTVTPGVKDVRRTGD